MKGNIDLQVRELSDAMRFASRELFDKLSVESVLAHSWEAGGVYPTLLGYGLGAIATLAIFGASHWCLRSAPPLVCVVVFFRTLWQLEHLAFAVLLVFSSLVGIGCTYIQVISWQQAFAQVAYRRKRRAKRLTKVDKED